MACNQSTKSIVNIPRISAGTFPIRCWGSQANQGTRFFLSDNPESIFLSPHTHATPFTNGFATLWSDTVNGRSSVRYRMFVWHLNRTGQNLKFGITVGNAGTTSYSIHNIRSSVQVVTNFINHGICAASALVGDSLDALSPVDSSIPAGGVGVVREWSVPAPVPPSTAESLVGGIIEFTVSNTAPGVSLNYRVRTSLALGTTANLRLNQTPVVPYISSSDGTHPRGSWDFTDITTSSDYAAGSGWRHFSISNGNPTPSNPATDDIMKDTNSYRIIGAPDNQGPAASNKGHFGTRHIHTVRLTNTSNADRQVKIYIAPQVYTYAGAVLWSGDGITYKVPRLTGPQSTGASPTMQQAVEVATVTVPRNTVSPMTRTITHSTGGSSSTPLMVIYQTL